MSMYTLTKADHKTAREKLQLAQTLLNVHAIAILEGDPMPPADVRLRQAEEAEDLIHDVLDLLDGIS